MNLIFLTSLGLLGISLIRLSARASRQLRRVSVRIHR